MGTKNTFLNQEHKKYRYRFSGLLFFVLFALQGSNTHAQSTNIQNVLSSGQWDSLFPRRAGTYGTHPQGYSSDFYSYTHFARAVEEMSDYYVVIRSKKGVWGQHISISKKSNNQTYLYADVDSWWHTNQTPEDIVVVDFATFLNEASTHNNKRELAAFLANISKETTGGWQLPVGSGSAGDYAFWGLYFVHEVGYNSTNGAGTYSQTHAEFPPNPKVGYYGRGPIQLSWNYNYGQFSKFIYNNKNVLLDYPDSIKENGVLAFKSAIWFWMMPQCPKPSCHQVMHDQWLHDSAYTASKMYTKGFAHTNNIINGGLECRSASSSAFTDKVGLRSQLYTHYLGVLGFNARQISEEDSGAYSTLCYASSGNAMEDYVNCKTNNAFYGSVGIDSQSACGSLKWIDGITYNRSNATAFHVLSSQDRQGNDSVVFLRLNILPQSEGIDSHTVCGPFKWIDGKTYSQSTDSEVYVIQGAAKNGCDSTVRLHLRMLQPSEHTDSHTVCGPFTWIDGITYTESTDSAVYVIQGASQNGCDSLVWLYLRMLQPTEHIDSHTVCGPFKWIDGKTYSQSTDSAVYVIKGASQNGCDSLVRLHLRMLQATEYIDSHTICGPFTWIDGITYTENTDSAKYVFKGGAVNGCDSVVYLNLSIAEIEAGVYKQDSTLIAISAEGTYQWGACRKGFVPIPGATGQRFVVKENGAYALEITQNGCVDTSECIEMLPMNLPPALAASSFVLYPNPVSGMLHMVHHADILKVEVFNPLGQLISTSLPHSPNAVWDFSAHDPGLYTVKLYAVHTFGVHKVLVIP